MLTARDAVPDRVRGLDAGADDYLTKPFALEELLARVRALGRRAGEANEDKLTVGDLELDLARHEARRGDQSIELTAKEFDLLAFLVRSPRQVFSRGQLLEHVWSSRSEWQDEATVTEHVRRVRHKVEKDPERPRWITTVRGVGYRFEP
jgi:DNA-binding response OmpR family regulator